MTTTIKLKTCDNCYLEVDESVVNQSETLKNLMEDVTERANKTELRLPNVSKKILLRVIDYCEAHVTLQKRSNEGLPTSEAEIEMINAKVVGVDQETLYGLINAANYLNIKSLLELLSQAVADRIKDKKPEEIRFIFNMKNDFSKAEEDAVRKESPWAFN